MRPTIPQKVLDGLTDVVMPKLAAREAAAGVCRRAGFTLPVRRCRALVLGQRRGGLARGGRAEAARDRCHGRHPKRFGGTSACSGSDKQTLHTAMRPTGATTFAPGGGARRRRRDGRRHRLCGSGRIARALSSLQYLGLPIPLDRLGRRAALSDRSRRGRPRDQLRAAHVAADGPGAGQGGDPSRRPDLQPLRRRVRILVDSPTPRRAAGCWHHARMRTDDNPLGLAVFLCDLAGHRGGGPGELYRDSVYPKHCFGALGLALEAGIEAVNLTESQFGIGTPREQLSLESVGHLRAVHALHLSPSIRAGVSAIFSATIIEPRASSPRMSSAKAINGRSMRRGCSTSARACFDLAIFRETQAGRKVLMDFNRNPRAGSGRR